MKRQTTFLNGICVRRLLLLVAMTMLWRVGWAAEKTVVIDGVTYYYGDFSSKSPSLTKKYGKNIALVGVETVVEKDGAYEYMYNLLPKQKTIKILSDVTVDGKTYPVVAFYNGTEIGDEDRYDCTLDVDGSVVEDVYFTRFFPNSFSCSYGATDVDEVPNLNNLKTVAHVPDSLMDKALSRKTAYVRVTDGNRWYFYDPFFGDDSYIQLQHGNVVYKLYYPADQKRYATCEFLKLASTDITVPASVNDGYIDLPISSVQFNSKIKPTAIDLHLQSIVDLKNLGSFSDWNNKITVHVPSELYDAAVAKYAKTCLVTDGHRLNGPTQSFTVTDDAGFKEKVILHDGVLSAEILEIPDVETVTVPDNVLFRGIEVPVTSLNFNSCGDNVKEIYFGSRLPGGFTGNVKAHVSDSQFDTASDCFTVKALFSDSRKAIHKSLLCDNISILYDVDGDGHLDWMLMKSPYNRYDDLSDKWIGPFFGMQGFTTDADDLFYSEKSWPYSDFYFYYGHFSQLSRDGKWYWINSDRNDVRDMSAEQVFVGNGTSLQATADINGDGCKEIIGNLGSTDGYYGIVRVLPDGTFVDDKIYVTSDTTILATIYDYSPNSGTINKRSGSVSGSVIAANVRSLADGMFVESKPNIDFEDMEAAPADSTGMRKRLVREGNQLRVVSLPSGTLSASDYNGDGLIDLNNGSNIYYNLGGNRFFRSKHKGTVYATDLTGDGLLDYIDFNNNQIDLYITKADGSMGEAKTLLKNSAVQNVFFGDFDHDGDVDILLFVKNSDYTLFQFYRNDGNGTFRAKDDNVDGLYTAVACNDYDGDGLYEILTTSNVLFKIGKNWSVSRTDLPSTEGTILTADINNDGMMKMLLTTNKYYEWTPVPGAVRNTRPEKMPKPSAVLFADANKLNISWQQGKDNETSSCDLTYELRIGTAPGKGDVYHGNANADGTRRVQADGNMGRALSYMYDTGNLAEGKYYIAVQAVDAGQLGGAWSDELVYDHKLTAPVITPMAGGCTADTVTLSVQNPVAAAAYEWTLGKAVVVGHNDNNSVMKVLFTEAGKHTLNVSMTLGGNTVKSADETITLTPSAGSKIVATDDKTLCVKYLIDIDQDGNAEIANTYYRALTFYEHKADGIWASIRKLWNTDISGTPVFSDFDRDGYPDFLLKNGSSSKMFYNSGEGDNTFDAEDVNIDDYSQSSYVVDWKNDGKYVPYNSGGKYYDFDRDGNMDTWQNKLDYDAAKAQTWVYLNDICAGVDLTFDVTGKLFYENNHTYSMSGFADFNNDGYADGYFFDSGNMVIVKGKPMSEWPCTETVAIPINCESYKESDVMLLDIDNNGYLDIIYAGDVWLMDKDFQFAKAQAPAGDYDEYHWQPLTPGAYPNGLASGIRNEAPSVPANVTVQNVNQGNMLIKWDDATDDHTPWAQMRYNISVKEKGRTGAGAFVLSPMNGLSDEAAILSGVEYRKATQLTVPKHVFTEGTTYEVQVQAIDLMGEHSAMSKPVEFVYNRYNYISVSDEKLYTHYSYVVSYRGEYSSKITCTADKDAKVTPWGDDQPTAFNIKWSTPGLKTVTMTDGTHTATLTVNVQDRPSLAIELPGKVMLNSPLTVRVPDVYASSVVKNVTMPQGDNYSVIYHYGDSTATFLFTEPCMTMVKVQGTLEGDTRIFTDESNIIEVVDQVMPTARLTSVEGEGRYYRVNWPTDVPSMVTQVEIARETNRLGQYETLCVLPVANATWCDLTSDNRVQPQRYRIRLLTADGVQKSDWAEPHNPLHVDINKTANGQGNNLMWNAYEGLDVQSYVILRGTSADKLQTIATVPATQLSYTDTDVPQGTCYYAVRFNEVRAMAQGVMRVERLDDKVQSNVISSDEAMPTIVATSISVVVVEKTAALSDSQPQLHLAAVILPSYATYNKVGWTVVSGGEYATIASNGVLTATGGKGDVVVRATTLDGSGLSTEITVPCDYTVRAQSISIFRPKTTVKVGESVQCEAMLLPRNVSMKNVAWRSDNEQVATVDNNGVVRGVSLGTVVITAATADGTQLTARTTLQVVESSGIHTVTADGDASLQYFTTDGKRIEKPRRGQIYVTNKGDKVLYK